MRAIVLVGGEGTRMRPLTYRTPKALVPILNRPLIDHLVLHLAQHGVDHVTLAMTQRNPMIRTTVEDGRHLGVPVHYAYEDTPMGSGGAIASIGHGWLAEGWRDTFVVINGDIITDLDLTAMLEAHRANASALTISLHEVEDPSTFGVAELQADGRIARFVEKPSIEEAPSNLINAGTWIFEPQTLERMDPKSFHMVERTLFPEVASKGGPIFGYPAQSYWMDVGNPEALRRVNLDLAAGIGSTPAVEGGAGIYVAEGGTVAESARLAAPVVIGRNVVIEDGAEVRESVLWNDIRVGRDASIVRSTLADGVTVGPRATIIDSVVAHGVEIEAGARVEGESLDPAEPGPAGAGSASESPA